MSQPKPTAQQHSATSKKTATPKRRTVDEKFDDLLADPDSDTLLQLMADEATRQYYNGETEEGGFG